MERYLVGDAGRYQTILPGKHRVLTAGQLWQNEAKKGNVFKVDKTQTWLPAPGRLTGISFDTEAWRQFYSCGALVIETNPCAMRLKGACQCLL